MPKIQCFLIKKNATSMNSPWLGTVPQLGGEELFGKITEILGMGGTLRIFSLSATDAFNHIRRMYPKDVGIMQVYEMVEDSNKIQFRHIPWP
jgi:hypothetical protein